MNERKDRVDDALHATKAAIEEGILPGGGVALLYAREAIKNKNSIGAEIVYKACGKPFEQILLNAGYNATDAQLFGKYKLVDSGNDHWAGIDIDRGDVIDYKESGIMDPTKVTRLALQNAASVAGTVLLTECTIIEDKDSDEFKDRGYENQGVPQPGVGM
jgi:chaperonin GroEL